MSGARHIGAESLYIQGRGMCSLWVLQETYDVFPQRDKNSRHVTFRGNAIHECDYTLHKPANRRNRRSWYCGGQKPRHSDSRSTDPDAVARRSITARLQGTNRFRRVALHPLAPPSAPARRGGGLRPPSTPRAQLPRSPTGLDRSPLSQHMQCMSSHPPLPPSSRPRLLPPARLGASLDGDVAPNRDLGTTNP